MNVLLVYLLLSESFVAGFARVVVNRIYDNDLDSTPGIFHLDNKDNIYLYI